MKQEWRNVMCQCKAEYGSIKLELAYDIQSSENGDCNAIQMIYM